MLIPLPWRSINDAQSGIQWSTSGPTTLLCRGSGLHVLLFYHMQRPQLCGCSAIARQVALTYTASIIVVLAPQQAGRPDLIRSPKRVLAHTWKDLAMC